jgi:hypothetical protein
MSAVEMSSATRMLEGALDVRTYYEPCPVGLVDLCPS